MPKLKTFLVNYSFNGYGRCRVEAKTQEEAENIFSEGGGYNDDTTGSDYEIDSVEEVK